MNDPIAQLLRSHRRLEEACDALLIAVADRDLDTVRGVSAFFGRQVRRHEEDEEQSLFPRLTSASGEVRAVLERLAREHLEHQSLHARLEQVAPTDDPWADLAKAADAIVEAYRAHIEAEESHVFPAARAALGSDELDAIQREMDARRGR